jgi:hypothetical protein
MGDVIVYPASSPMNALCDYRRRERKVVTFSDEKATDELFKSHYSGFLLTGDDEGEKTVRRQHRL